MSGSALIDQAVSAAASRERPDPNLPGGGEVRERDRQQWRDVEEVPLLDALLEGGGLVRALDGDVRGEDHERRAEDRGESSERRGCA